MMQKIIRFDTDDLALDPEGVAEALNHACTGRTGLYWVRSLCRVGDSVFFVLLPLGPEQVPETYIFVSVDDESVLGVSALFEARWAAGFDVVGTVRIGETLLALFARPRDSRK
ncbi:MAG: hypothetical protein GXP31_12070 [Kiritimatiellaeota bacterium]|nr:hypothetical protein [Kiritimatiellota bacterium]